MSSAAIGIKTPAPPAAAALTLPPAMRVTPVVVAKPLPVPAPAERPVQPATGPDRFGHVFATMLLWALIMAGATLLVRLGLTRGPVARQPVQPDVEGQALSTGPATWHDAAIEPLVERFTKAAMAPGAAVGFASSYRSKLGLPGGHGAAAEVIEAGDYKNRCVSGLRHAGWDARTRFSAGQPGPDVIARSGGLVLALQCHPSADPVDVRAVQDACLVRERQRSDLAAIVSNASFTEAARQLAACNGIVLLHEDELASFAA